MFELIIYFYLSHTCITLDLEWWLAERRLLESELEENPRNDPDYGGKQTVFRIDRSVARRGYADDEDDT
jgi:hypothetical protein